MNRNEILSLIEGPERAQYGALAWFFISYRKVGHSGGPVRARSISLLFDPAARAFKAECRRRVSKRKKRVTVKASAGLVAHLRSRLTPAELAECARAAITYDPYVIPF